MVLHLPGGGCYEALGLDTDYERLHQSHVNASKYPGECTICDETPEIQKPCNHHFVQNRKKYYQMQSCHTLGQEKDQVSVPMYISIVHEDWVPALKDAIVAINKACPGVHLHETEQWRAKIVIRGSSNEDDSASTRGNIQTERLVIITLCHGWPNKKRTSVHKLLHALGAQHEHQAAGAGGFLLNKCSPKHELYDQYKPLPNVMYVTPMDPFSIMMYDEGGANDLLRKEGSDPVWKLKPPGETNNEMSELDKVGLNQMYPPCRSAEYNPVRSSVTGMWYCGRNVMQNHNRPAGGTTDGYCGPTNRANCPACRSLKNPVVEEFVSKGRWQGWSGLVYCGRYFGQQQPGHDGYCGPNNGPSCLECASILLPR